MHPVWRVHKLTASLETICPHRAIRDSRTTSKDAADLEVLDCMHVWVRVCVCVCLLKPHDTRVRRPFLWLEAQLVYISEGGARSAWVWTLRTSGKRMHFRRRADSPHELTGRQNARAHTGVPHVTMETEKQKIQAHTLTRTYKLEV